MGEIDKKATRCAKVPQKTVKEWLETIETPTTLYRALRAHRVYVSRIEKYNQNLPPGAKKKSNPGKIKVGTQLEALTLAFDWEDTEEGYEEWVALYNKLKILIEKKDQRNIKNREKIQQQRSRENGPLAK